MHQGTVNLALPLGLLSPTATGWGHNHPHWFFTDLEVQEQNTHNLGPERPDARFLAGRLPLCAHVTLVFGVDGIEGGSQQSL